MKPLKEKAFSCVTVKTKSNYAVKVAERRNHFLSINHVAQTSILFNMSLVEYLLFNLFFCQHMKNVWRRKLLFQLYSVPQSALHGKWCSLFSVDWYSLPDWLWISRYRLIFDRGCRNSFPGPISGSRRAILFFKITQYYIYHSIDN